VVYDSRRAEDMRVMSAEEFTQSVVRQRITDSVHQLVEWLDYQIGQDFKRLEHSRLEIKTLEWVTVVSNLDGETREYKFPVYEGTELMALWLLKPRLEEIIEKIPEAKELDAIHNAELWVGAFRKEFP
jgi:hypothetical protein